MPTWCIAVHRKRWRDANSPTRRQDDGYKHNGKGARHRSRVRCTVTGASKPLPVPVDRSFAGHVPASRTARSRTRQAGYPGRVMGSVRTQIHGKGVGGHRAYRPVRRCGLTSRSSSGTSCTWVAPAAATRWRASANCCSEISTPSTYPLGPTASAMLRVDGAGSTANIQDALPRRGGCGCKCGLCDLGHEPIDACMLGHPASCRLAVPKCSLRRHYGFTVFHVPMPLVSDTRLLSGAWRKERPASSCKLRGRQGSSTALPADV